MKKYLMVFVFSIVFSSITKAQLGATRAKITEKYGENYEESVQNGIATITYKMQDNDGKGSFTKWMLFSFLKDVCIISATSLPTRFKADMQKLMADDKKYTTLKENIWLDPKTNYYWSIDGSGNYFTLSVSPIKPSTLK